MKYFTLLFLLISSPLFSQTDDTPTWALKPGTVGIGLAPTLNINTFGVGSGFSNSVNRCGLGLIGLYSLRELLTFYGGAGFGSVSNKYNGGGGGSVTKISGLNLGLGALIPIRIFENVKRTLAISPNIGINTFLGNTKIETPGFPEFKEGVNAFQFEVGIKTELFFSQFFSLQTPIGISFSISALGTQFDQHDGSSSTSIWIFDRPDESFNFLNAAVGFQYYFF